MWPREHASTLTSLHICKITGLHNWVRAHLHDCACVLACNCRLASLHASVHLHACTVTRARACKAACVHVLAQLRAWLFAKLLARTSMCLPCCMLARPRARRTACSQNWALAASSTCTLANYMLARSQTTCLHDRVLAGSHACTLPGEMLHPSAGERAVVIYRGDACSSWGGDIGTPKMGFGAPRKS